MGMKSGRGADADEDGDEDGDGVRGGVDEPADGGFSRSRRRVLTQQTAGSHAPVRCSLLFPNALSVLFRPSVWRSSTCLKERGVGEVVFGGQGRHDVPELSDLGLNLGQLLVDLPLVVWFGARVL